MYLRPCARCGSRPRWSDTYLCEQCSLDPQKTKEIAEALANRTDNMNSARNYLVKTFHWYGWSKR